MHSDFFIFKINKMGLNSTHESQYIRLQISVKSKNYPIYVQDQNSIIFHCLIDCRLPE
jgi:ribosomal protein L31